MPLPRSRGSAIAATSYSFRKACKGPEARLESFVAGSTPALLSSDPRPAWVGTSVPLGAGYPDILAATFSSDLLKVAAPSNDAAHILGYLRSVGRATLPTLTNRLQLDETSAVQTIEMLLSGEAVCSSGKNSFRVSDSWRRILPEVVAIEVKVSNWKVAVRQAERNRIFCDRSYISVPVALAARIKSPIRLHPNLGLLGVSDGGDVSTEVHARLTPISAWSYYYILAMTIARTVKGKV